MTMNICAFILYAKLIANVNAHVDVSTNYFVQIFKGANRSC